MTNGSGVIKFVQLAQSPGAHERKISSARHMIILTGCVALLQGILSVLISILPLPQVVYTTIPGVGGANLIGGLTLLVLAAGIFKNSRTCAIVLFILQWLGVLIIAVAIGNFQWPQIIPPILSFFGVIGTFKYHSILSGSLTQQMPSGPVFGTLDPLGHSSGRGLSQVSTRSNLGLVNQQSDTTTWLSFTGIALGLVIHIGAMVFGIIITTVGMMVYLGTEWTTGLDAQQQQAVMTNFILDLYKTDSLYIWGCILYEFFIGLLQGIVVARCANARPYLNATILVCITLLLSIPLTLWSLNSVSNSLDTIKNGVLISAGLGEAFLILGIFVAVKLIVEKRN